MLNFRLVKICALFGVLGIGACGGGGGDRAEILQSACNAGNASACERGATAPNETTVTTTSTAPSTTQTSATSNAPSSTPTSAPSPLPNDTQDTPPISIQFGTGNLVTPYSATLYKKDYSILISDASGNPVSGASVTVSVWPIAYRKGRYRWMSYTPGAISEPGSWVFDASLSNCANEDVNRNGVRDAGEDINDNGALEPGVPITVNISGVTDAAGIANISLIYPKDRANWTDVELTVRGTVVGTESVAKNAFALPGLADDYTKLQVSPPGQPSPYGVEGCASRL
jgi:hypothetical protein